MVNATPAETSHGCRKGENARVAPRSERSLSMSDGWLALAYALPAVPIWAAYVLARRRRNDRHETILADSIEAGLTEPPSLHPVVDLAACIGCGACVQACPEGDVLGMIDDKAHLIDPTQCIGHGACQTACPAGAIALVFGTETRGMDIPVLRPDFETNVPGIYIAGELGGMGLIRNAIEQGRQAMGSIITATACEDAGDDMLDVLVVGAGPAGIAASLAAMEAGLTCKTLEQDSLGGTVAHYPRGKVVMTAPVSLPLYGTMNFREVSKEQLIGLWTDVIETTGVRIAYGERVDEVVAIDGGFAVTSRTGIHRARRILLATGRRGTPRKLDVLGEELSKVVYRLVDPEQYRGKKVLVVGGGDSALEAALTLADQPGTSVTLAYRGRSFSRARRVNRERLIRATDAGRIGLRLETNVTVIERNQVGLQAAAHSKIENEAVIICAGGVLPNAYLRSMGVAIETKFGTL